jgi:hypothetical protein
MATPNWDAIKPRFEAGETPEDLAKAFKCDAQKIRNRAKSQGWSKKNQPQGGQKATRTRPSEMPRPKVATHVAADTAAVSVDILDVEDYVEQHRDDWQGLRLTAIKLLAGLDYLDPSAQAKQLTAIATALKCVQDGQRKALGLDKDKPAGGGGDGSGDAQPIKPADLDGLSLAELERLYQDEVAASQGDPGQP